MDDVNNGGEATNSESIGQGTPAPSKAAVYWVATRSYSFPASIVSVLLGTALAARGYCGEARFDLTVLALTLLGALFAHAGGNVLNDYFDYIRGVDTRPEHGSGVLPSGQLNRDEMLRFGIALLLLGAACGGTILWLNPDAITTVVPLSSLGLYCAVAYTSFLKERALGDLTIMTAFGLGLTLGAYGVQTPLVSGGQILAILFYALPLTLLVDGILHANNMRDTATDKAAGVTTLAAVLGPDRSRQFQAILLFGPLALIVLFVVFGMLPWVCLFTFAALPTLRKGFETGDVPFIAQSHLLFGILYAATVAFGPKV